MRFLIAPDKFRGSASAAEVASWIASGLKQELADAEIDIIPMADGGEGTEQVLTRANGGKEVEVVVRDPLERPTRCVYGLSKDGKTAYMEMAMASGLALLNFSERNPLETSTLGTGDMIKDAIGRGVNRIILGLGGSATNDGGIGMAHALGYRFLNKHGASIYKGGQLAELDRIDSSGAIPAINSVRFDIACDVPNVLLGPQGATHIYGPQKGASAEKLELLEFGMEQLERVAEKHFHKTVSDIPGSGAAGGLGAGCAMFLNANLHSGIDLILEETHLEDHIAKADVVITGEGTFDRQSLHGKVVWGVGNMVRKMGKPLVVVCGQSTIHREKLFDKYTNGLYCITDMADNLSDAMNNTQQYLEQIGRQIACDWKG